MNEINKEHKDGIINLNNYIFWTKAVIVKPYIMKYLKEKFKNDLFLYEFNKIDIVILGENIPVEIQSTNARLNCRNSYQVSHAEFEDRIRRQIEDNIINYGKCWFFFDSEYHRYLNDCTLTQVSINFDWFAKYVKEEKLKVFTVKYDGEIKELKYEDLSFIRNLSNTCNIECNDDERILNKNKLDILNTVLKHYKFTQQEIDEIMDSYNKNLDYTFKDFLNKSDNKRTNLYGDVWSAMNSLNDINDILNMECDYNRSGKHHGKILGIFKFENGNHMQFIDSFDICKYFPGYIRKSESWKSLKGTSITEKHLRDIFWTKQDKNQPTLFDY